MTKNKTEACSFQTEIKKLSMSSPDNLYFLYGPEDYLSMYYLDMLRDRCIPGGDDGFSLKKFEGPGLDCTAFETAVNSMPFLTERTFVEVHNADLNRLPDTDNLISVLKDIPEWCTVVFVQDFTFEPDGRLKIIKFLKSAGTALCFAGQDESSLVAWIKKRFSALGKMIDTEACYQLLFMSGKQMNRLIPEIDKISGYVKDENVTKSDVLEIATRIPEADVFDMVGAVAAKRFDRAFEKLSDLLNSRDSEPIAIVSLVGTQFRRLYGVRLCIENGGGYREVSELLNTSWDKLINESCTAARGFSLPELKRILKCCADTDFSMKSTSMAPEELLKDLMLTIMRHG